MTNRGFRPGKLLQQLSRVTQGFQGSIFENMAADGNHPIRRVVVSIGG